MGFWTCTGIREGSEIQARGTLELGGSSVGVYFKTFMFEALFCSVVV